MSACSFQAIDVHIGPWHWQGAAAPVGHRLEHARRLSADGGPSWDAWQPIDEPWREQMAAVEEIARAGMEAGQLAWRAADVAIRKALTGTYRDRPVISTTDLRRVAGAPRCAITLHGVGIEVDTGAGALVRAIGAPRTVRIVGDVHPQVIRAVRYAHRQAFHLAEAAMLDAAAQIGDLVPPVTPLDRATAC